ncbi:uncharacterized protein LOC126815389 isoform X2 [Patella vulgata]|nr:uncharacterized protein LOC126815389 isoform X2 [Patella vulgata]
MATGKSSATQKATLTVNQHESSEKSAATNGPQQQPVRRKSGMLLELRDYEEDEMYGPEAGNSSRRPSTSSLSRYRSCPQLASALSKPDSPGSDLLTIDEPSTDDISPNISRTFQSPDSDRSCTPTPPSSPGSRRSDTSKSIPGNTTPSWDPSSPSSTPKLHRRARKEHKYDRIASTESAPREINLRLPLREDTSSRFDRRRERDSKTFSDLYDSPPDVSIDYRVSETSDDDSIKYHGQNHLPDDGRDKCERWLQTLKLSNADRIKSRSQMQLPPM